MAINFNELSTTAPVPTKDEVDNKIDKLSGTIPTGNLLKIANDGGVEDSGKSLDDISQEIQDAIQYAVVVDDKLVPVDGSSSEEVFYNGSYGDTYLAEHLPSWTCNDSNQNAVLRNRYGWTPEFYHYDLSLFTDRIVFWVEGKGNGEHGVFTRSIVFPKSGVYTLDIEYAAGYVSYPSALGQARFVVDAGTSGEQDVIGVNDSSIVQHAQVQFAANAGAGSITIKGKTGLSGNACCVVIASVKVTLIKEIGIEIGDIVAPDASAQTGQAADAKATHVLLSAKASKPETYLEGNLAEFDENGDPTDSGKSLDDISQMTTLSPVFTGSWVFSDGLTHALEPVRRENAFGGWEYSYYVPGTAEGIRYDSQTWFNTEEERDAAAKFIWDIYEFDGTEEVETGTLTATHTLGYQLGDQEDKPLQPAGRYVKFPVYNGENHEFLDANAAGSPIAGFTAAGTHRWTTYRNCIVYLRAMQSADTKPVMYVHVNNQDAPAQGDTSRLLFKQTLAKDDGIVTPIFLNAGDSLDIRLTDSISQLNYSVFYID